MKKKTSKRKSSIPDFFKPRSREQIVTPAKKARKDAGRESSASDSSRPESECPPVEPPFVKGLEAPTIVVDDSNGPITIDETCAEKRRVLHKVKSLKTSRDGAAERRRERLKGGGLIKDRRRKKPRKKEKRRGNSIRRGGREKKRRKKRRKEQWQIIRSRMTILNYRIWNSQFRLL